MELQTTTLRTKQLAAVLRSTRLTFLHGWESVTTGITLLLRQTPSALRQRFTQRITLLLAFAARKMTLLQTDSIAAGLATCADLIVSLLCPARGCVLLTARIGTEICAASVRPSPTITR